MELYHKYFILLLLLLFLYMSGARAQGKQRPWNNSVSAILVFGDSTVDPGNNDFIRTAFRSNFPPYGKDFENKTPTGRFTNGRLATDFIASYVGIKEYLPPYLNSTLSIDDLMTGVSFASAGSGFDPLTARISNVVDMPQQLQYFKEYKKRLESAIGKQAMEKRMQKTFFIISAGTNDFIVNYFTLPIRRKTFTVSAYQHFVLQNAQQFLQALWDEGARRILVTGLPPMGCLPAVITMNSQFNALFQRRCVGMYCSVAQQYNQMLQNAVKSMHLASAHLGAKIYSLDIYTALADIIQDPGRHGFDDISTGCCGTGFLEAGFLCNPNSYVCPDASKYVFWDSIHPTEKTYNIIFNAFRSIIDDMIRD
ncbi:GDSL esterase/lipase [Melia azedarach]|uniref:GDSL esterase/lipase n=1 Tax=Melia azedarach TaxID=155640 RepID=A0ACC1WX49_MELAZ|nr:GDSL esterase/lipase [Melia azedarach]